jgi:Flp pilus assembly protein TadD
MNRLSIAAPVACLLLAAGALLPAAGTHAQTAAQVARPPAASPVPRQSGPVASRPYDAALRQYRDGNLEAALGIAERALQVDARDIRLRFLRGVALTGLGRTDAAIEAFRAMISDFPELPEPYNNLAVLHAGRGELDAAFQALQDAVRAMPTYGLAHENLGDLHLRLAASAYRQARDLDPANASAATKLGLATELIDRMQPPSDSPIPR